MEDIIGKIGELLSDKESMQQLSELAQMFTAQEQTECEDEAENEQADCKSEGDESDNSSEDSSTGGFDFGMLFRLQEIMGTFSQKDKNSELLMALKPHLCEERQEKVDKAVKLLRLLAVFSILKESGILEDIL